MPKTSIPVWKVRTDPKNKTWMEITTTIGDVEISVTRNNTYNIAAGFPIGSFDTIWMKKGTDRMVFGSELFKDPEEAKKYALSRVDELQKKFSAKPKRTRRPKGPGISYSIYD